jgi:putative ABC transport system permease protein
MHIAGRAVRSLIRKPLKNLLVFTIIFVMACFLIVAFACEGASVVTRNESKQAIGAAFRLELNIADNIKRTEAELEPVQLENGAWLIVAPNNQFDSLLLDDIEKVAAVEGIKTYDITTRPTAVLPVNFKRIEDENRDQSVDFGGVNLIGCREMGQNSNVALGNITLKEGRMVTPEDQNAIVISEQLAELNGLRLGDTLSFKPAREKDGDGVNGAEIVGIFTLLHDIPAIMKGDTFRSENAIFCDLRFPEKAEGHDGDSFFASAVFQVEDTDKYHEIGEKIRSLDIGWQRYNLVDNNGTYEQMSDNFNNMGAVSRMLIIIVSCASLLILLLVLLFWVRGRRKEIGVFMSLGIKKRSIIAQFLTEIILVAVLAFGLSLAVSPAVSETAASYIAEGQKQEIEQRELELRGQISGNIDRGTDEMLGVSVEITPKMTAVTGGLVLALVSSAVMLASVTTMRKSTVNILHDL